MRRAQLPPLYWWRRETWAVCERTGAYCVIRQVDDVWRWAIAVDGEIVASGQNGGNPIAAELRARRAVKVALSKLPAKQKKEEEPA